MNDHDRLRCDEAHAMIEAAVRGRLGEASLASLREHARSCDACDEAWTDARFVRGLFQNVESPRCPDRVAASILAQVDAEEATRPSRSVRRATPGTPARRRRRLHWITGAAAAAVVAAALLWPSALRPPREPAPMDPDAPFAVSDAELREAEEEVKLAMAMVSRAMSRTTGVLQTQVRDRITQPIIQGLDRGLRAVPAPETTAGEQEQSRIQSPPDGLQTVVLPGDSIPGKDKA